METIQFTQNATQFERELSLNFKNIYDHVTEENNTNWTKAVNKILDITARNIRPNLKVAACKLDTADCTEWLYDFVCYENDFIGLIDVLLVAECEWKNPRGNIDYIQDIQDDFEKLLVAKSPYRLMIFEGDSQQDVQNIISHLISRVKSYKLSSNDDRYMFAAWMIGNEFYFDIYIHTI